MLSLPLLKQSMGMGFVFEDPISMEVMVRFFCEQMSSLTIFFLKFSLVVGVPPPQKKMLHVFKVTHHDLAVLKGASGDDSLWS